MFSQRDRRLRFFGCWDNCNCRRVVTEDRQFRLLALFLIQRGWWIYFRVCFRVRQKHRMYLNRDVSCFRILFHRRASSETTTVVSSAGYSSSGASGVSKIAISRHDDQPLILLPRIMIDIARWKSWRRGFQPVVGALRRFTESRDAAKRPRDKKGKKG